jgi:hypothetical protein
VEIKMINPEDRNFGWKSKHDPRSKEYDMRSLLRRRDIEIKRVMWDEGVVLDQGTEGACVGFAWMGELLAAPAQPEKQPEFNKANRIAFKFYKRAQQIDEWPGDNYEGTSVLAGAKVMKENGFISSYRWCFNVEDVRDTVISEGPVVVGVPWKSGMYSTTKSGLVTLTGRHVGGHALVITGYDPAMKFGNQTYEVFRWRNSWNTTYGVDGSGYIRVQDLARLLKSTGEACVPMGRKPVRFKPSLYSSVMKLFRK